MTLIQDNEVLIVINAPYKYQKEVIFHFMAYLYVFVYNLEVYWDTPIFGHLIRPF